MNKLWAVYGTVDHRARQVLVLTQLTDDAPAASDEPINVVEWNDGGPEAEARGSTLDLRSPGERGEPGAWRFGADASAHSEAPAPRGRR